MLLTLIQQFGVHFKLKALLCFCAFNRPGSVWPQHIPAHVFLTLGYLQLFIHWFVHLQNIHPLRTYNYVCCTESVSC